MIVEHQAAVDLLYSGAGFALGLILEWIRKVFH